MDDVGSVQGMASRVGRDLWDDVPPVVWLAGGVLVATWSAEELAVGTGHPVFDVALLVSGVCFAISGTLGVRTQLRDRMARAGRR